MSNWINNIIASTYDQYSEAINEQLNTESTLSKLTKKKYPEPDPIYGPTRVTMHEVHARMFLETLQEMKELFLQMGSPISFYGDDEGSVYVQIGSAYEMIL